MMTDAFFCGRQCLNHTAGVSVTTASTSPSVGRMSRQSPRYSVASPICSILILAPTRRLRLLAGCLMNMSGLFVCVLNPLAGDVEVFLFKLNTNDCRRFILVASNARCAAAHEGIEDDGYVIRKMAAMHHSMTPIRLLSWVVAARLIILCAASHST